jgi:hypothetical protein
VKRYSGDDSWGVAPCENSSLPGLILKREKPFRVHLEGFSLCISY